MNLDRVSEVFARAADLEGSSRDDYLRGVRAEEPAVADEVESLLGFHATGPGGDAASGGDGGGGTRGSVLDLPAAALLGPGALHDDDLYAPADEPPLAAGTLLIAEGVWAEPAVRSAPGAEPGGAGDAAGSPAWSYRIARELGRGGMGIVYEAEQAFPSRRIALKLLRGGAGRGTTVPGRGESGAVSNAARRLMLEAEALGALHHPGIAHVHAAGTLRQVGGGGGGGQGAGWLFIAMELVEGPTLNAWAVGKSAAAKVQMVAELCDAVEHAHQRGVVHRDLKPGNILVEMGGTARPAGAAPPVAGRAKVLDFGVARLTNRPRGGATLSVGRGQLVGTLRYMSPEQARGGASGADERGVDSRADVYALGTILYELLTGTPPIAVDDASIVGAVERIVTQRPAPPAGLAGTVGRRRAADLQTVLFKALEKDPAERYQHAGDLGADLRRILADEPITARPPTAGEQLMRLVRRNRVASSAIAAGLALVVMGGAVAAWQAVRATRALRLAREESAVTRSALQFMERMINTATPEEMRGQDTTVREMLHAAVIEARAMPDNRAAAAACRVLAGALQEVGEPAAAEPLARRALAINRAALGESSAETIESGLLAARIGAERGRTDEAVREVRAWRDLALRRFGPDHAVSLRSAMALEYALNPDDPAQLAEAETLLNDTVQRMTALHGPDGRATLSAMSDLCALYLNSQRVGAALPLAREVYQRRLRLLGEDHPETLVAMGNLTAALANTNALDQALELNARNIELAVRVLGIDHPSTQYARSNRIQMLWRLNRLKEAEGEARAVWEARTRRLGPDTRLAMTARGLYISVILAQARFDEVEPMIREFIARNDALFGPHDPDTLQAVTLLWDWAEGKDDRATMDAAAARLKGTRFDPAVAVQQPPIGSKKKDKPGSTPP